VIRLACAALLLGCAGLTWAGDAPLPSLSSAVVAGEVLHANTLEFAGITFRDVNTNPHYAKGDLAFENLEAKAYRGRISGAYAIDLDGEHRVHRCHFDLTGIDLGLLIRSLGSTNEDINGRLDGWFEMVLPIGDSGGITGAGQITISDATLVQMPLLVSFLAGNPSAAKGKDTLTARFQLRDKGVDLLWLRLESPAILLAAQGRIGFDRQLDIEIAPRLPFAMLDKVPLIGPWMAGGLSRLTNNVTRAHLRGDVSQPVLVVNTFGR
jgi:hypothetical protein